MGSTSCSVSSRLYCFGTDQTNALAPLTNTGRMAFVSFSFVPGGGVAAADTLCQNEASGLYPGTYKALLATEGASAASRFSTDGPIWVRPDGVAIVNKPSDLANDFLLAPIDEYPGGMYQGNLGVWVGASSLSEIASGTTCSSWTSNSSAQKAGSTRSGYSSVDGESAACNATWMSVWCLQE
jgi:hypothetical protein